MEFLGEFETHITVRLDGQTTLERYRDAWTVALDLCLALQADQITIGSAKLRRIARLKLESAPWTLGIPQATAEAQSHPSDRYFEPD